MPAEPIKILAVDDIEANLVALDAALDLPGVELVKAAGSVQALELLLHEDFALALLDVQMPEIDGFELAELMRSTERTRGVPIIFLTAIATDERRRFRGFETGAVDYLHKPLDVQILRSKVAVFVELARQRKELARQRDELGAALGRLRAHGDNSPLAVLELDADLRIVTWAEGARRLFGQDAAAMLGTRMEDAPFLVSDTSPEFLAGMRQLLNGGDHRELQKHRFRRADGAIREGEWYCSSLSGKAHATSALMLQVLDVTERVRAEETQRLLIGELNHRVKNTLATVQAIASQSLRRANSLDQFSQNFNGRLQSLSRAHSLLSATTWESASLRKLIADQLSIGAASEDRLILSGRDTELSPEMALRFALVLHELTTNAHKHGALATPRGQVAITWKVEDGILTLNWVETGGAPVQTRDYRGFGSELIEGSLVPCGGRAEAEFHPEGIRWSIMLPLNGGAPAKPASASAATPRAEIRPETGHTAKPGPIEQPASPPGQGPAGLRVLIVEDEPLVAMEIALQLEDEAMVPLGPATSCRQALALIQSERPDLVLLDGNLNGERVDAVANELAASGTPFAFVSGYGSDLFPEGHNHRPALGKPFTSAALMKVVEALAQERVSA
jgi:PAS domain S-box-containing protein